MIDNTGNVNIFVAWAFLCECLNDLRSLENQRNTIVFGFFCCYWILFSVVIVVVVVVANFHSRVVTTKADSIKCKTKIKRRKNSIKQTSSYHDCPCPIYTNAISFPLITMWIVWSLAVWLTFCNITLWFCLNMSNFNFLKWMKSRR